MQKSWSCLISSWITLWLVGSTQANFPASTPSNSIGQPGQPLYYLMADTGSSVGPNEELKRTNRSLIKWWEDLFRQNNCCNNNNNNLLYNNNLAPGIPNIVANNNCNGFQLQSLDSLDPFKQTNWFKKLPDLWGNSCGQCGQCGGQQPINTNYAPITNPAYGGDNYAPLPPQQPAGPVDYSQAPAAPSNGAGYETPNNAYDGPADGDAGYVAPEAPAAPQPAPDSYAAPPATPEYEAPAPAPPATNYEAPAPTPSYEPQAPAPAPESYSKVEEYPQPVKSYGDGAQQQQQQQQQPQIVYQPIIYLSASPAVRDGLESKLKQQEQSYEPQTEATPQQPAYEQPTPQAPYTYTPAPAPAPPAPCNAPACAGYLPILGVPFYGYPSAPPAASVYHQPAPQQAPVYSAPQAPVYAAPPAPAPVYEAPPAPPAPVYAPPPAPVNGSPCCQTPLRLSLVDQPYRVAPELFQDYHYRLSLADQRGL